MLEMEPCKRPGEEWCKNQPNVATPQRHDVPTSRSHNVATSQQTLSLGDAIKGTRESNCGGSKFVCRVRV